MDSEALRTLLNPIHDSEALPSILGYTKIQRRCGFLGQAGKEGVSCSHVGLHLEAIGRLGVGSVALTDAALHHSLNPFPP
jgi:hypothetical protein